MRKPKYAKSLIQCNEGYEGESIESMLERVKTTEEPIESISPTIYTLRKDGVRPEYDIRTDKWDIAQDAMQNVQAKWKEQRAENRKKWDKTAPSAEQPTGTE